MNNRLESVLSVVVAVAAVGVSAALVKREFVPPASVVTERTGPPRLTKDWELLVAEGVITGNSSAPVKVIEFSDLECPFCKRFHETLRRAQGRFRDSVAHVFIHSPIASHRFARVAARAAECAAREGHFATFLDVAYQKQDSFGMKSWGSYGREAGVRDTAKFAKCALDRATVPRIEAGVKATERLSVAGTPTVIVNGWRFVTPPTDSQLVRLIADLVARRSPNIDRVMAP